MRPLKERIQKLIEALDTRLLERKTLIRISILTIFSKHHIMLYGVPGVAKTFAINNIIKIIDKEVAWQITMSNETGLDDLIPEPQREAQEVLNDPRCILSQRFIFLDEMFKGTQNLLNALLPVLNERVYQLSGKNYPLKLNTVFAASNEIPQDDFIEPFRDRILFWFDVKRLAEQQNKLKYYKEDFTAGKELEEIFTIEDIEEVNEYIDKTKSLKMSEDIAKLYEKIIIEILRNSISLSDRKSGSGFIIKALKTSAVLNNRNAIDHSDLLLMKHCTWTDLDQRVLAFEAVERCIFGSKAAIQKNIISLIQNFRDLTSRTTPKIADLIELIVFLDFNRYDEILKILKNYNQEIQDFEKKLNELLADKEEKEAIFQSCLDNVFISDDVYQCATPYKEEEIVNMIDELVTLFEIEKNDIQKKIDELDSYDKYHLAFTQANS